MFSSAPNVCLLRTIALGSQAADERGARRSNNTFVSNVASAVFWLHDTGTAPNGSKRDTDTDANSGVATAAGDPDMRTLRGELFVPKGSKQSFTFPRFACSVRCLFYIALPCEICLGIVAQTNQTKQYSIALLPPKMAGFVLTAPEDPLLTQIVTITMVGAPGVIPSSQMPPGYDVRTEGNYTITTGFLENGNQRFLHHYSH
jgi:hypothetical protein